MFHVKHSLWRRWCSRRRRPRPPARLGDLASLGAASRSPPVPSGPSGALHTGGTWCAGPARPRHRQRAPQPGLDVTHPHRSQALTSPTRTATGYRVKRLLASSGHSGALNGGVPIALGDSASIHGCEVFNQGPYPSIGGGLPLGDGNCVIPSHHRSNGDICRAKC